jgi:serine phosphatase RsbU (regulator of sigma subunit)
VRGSGDGAEAPRVDIDSAEELAAAVARLWGEFHRTQDALWRREAELAAGVPVAPHPQESQQLAARLQATLKGGAKALGCQAAGLYLLDEATTELKLRASWGLPRARLTDSPRKLCDATADIEALAGHAVTLEDASQAESWNPPERRPSAVCVPVSTPTTPLGTLWMFCGKARPFSDKDVNLAEIVAGRLAADLEREMLMVEALDGAQRKRQLGEAARWQANLQPRIAPLLDDWEIAAWTEQARDVGGDFHDWFIRRDDVVTLAVGSSQQRAVEGALSSAAIRASLRAHGEYEHPPHQLLERMNRTLWTSSAGDQACHAWIAMVDAQSNEVQFATAGSPAAMLVSASSCDPMVDECLPLGVDPSATYRTGSRKLSAGEAIVAVSPGLMARTNADGKGSFGDVLRQSLRGKANLSARSMVDLLKDAVQTASPQNRSLDSTILVLRRRGR